MRPFQITRYIKKYTLPIVVVSLLAGILFYLAVTFVFQSYVAQTVIRYPEGTTVNTSEIYASNIVSEAMDNLGLDKSTVNTDYIRNNISVTPVVSEEETLLREAKIQNGESYDNEPYVYLVTYTSSVSEGKEFARTMLNEILDVYLNWYGETYENTSGGANTVSDIYDKDYDYIEIMQVVDDFMQSTMDDISDKIQIDDNFRSYASGYSFTDLYNEFRYLKNDSATDIAADILNNKITKNRDVLISKYNKRNSDMTTANAASQEEIDKIKGIISSYVTMMSESDNTNITSEYILQEVYDSYYRDDSGNLTSGDTTVQYDRLLDGYVDDRTSYESNLLDIAYNQYIIDTFTTAAAASSDAEQADINTRITALVDKLNSLSAIYDVTNDEFNEYLGALNVSMVSSIGVAERIPVTLFTLATILIFGVLCCGGAVVIGRVGDVMEYYAFTDKIDGLPNRTSCDNYLEAKDGKLLFGDFSAVVLKITNLREINAQFGREVGDKALKSFVSSVTGAFVPSDDVFVGNNGSAQYLVFAKGYSRERTNNCIGQIIQAINLINDENAYTIEFNVGMAEAASDKCYNIRKLLSLAMANSRLANQGYAPDAPVDRQSTSAEDKKEVVNFGSDESVYVLGSDYYSKFKSMKDSSKKH